MVFIFNRAFVETSEFELGQRTGLKEEEHVQRCFSDGFKASCTSCIF
jgi:hypothetical protein